MPYGIVKEKNKDLVMVMMERQDMCGECHACELLSGKKQCTLTCKTRVSCEVGDHVEVTLGTEHFLKATYIMYGVPLVGFLAGFLLSLGLINVLQIEGGDLWIALGSLIGAAVGVLYIKCRDRKKVYHKYLPYIIARVENKLSDK